VIDDLKREIGIASPRSQMLEVKLRLLEAFP